jgi:hypothetical protein
MINSLPPICRWHHHSTSATGEAPAPPQFEAEVPAQLPVSSLPESIWDRVGLRKPLSAPPLSPLVTAVDSNPQKAITRTNTRAEMVGLLIGANVFEFPFP